MIPTARPLLASGNVGAPYSGLKVPAVGSVSADHALPFQWYTTGPIGGLHCSPTAHASVLVRAKTPFSWVLVPVAGMLTTGAGAAG